MATETIETYGPGGRIGTARTVSTPDPTPEQVNERTLRERAQLALTVNDAFLALPNPTNAQTLTQVQRLTRENSALIRLIIRALETTDGT